MNTHPQPSLSRRTLGVAALASAGVAALSACSLVGRRSSASPGSDVTDADPPQTQTPTSTTPTASSTPAPADHAITKAWPSEPGLPASGFHNGRIGAPHLSLVVQSSVAPQLPREWVWQLGGTVGAPPLDAAEGQEWVLAVLRPWAPMNVTAKYAATARLTAGNTELDVAKLAGTYQKEIGFVGKTIAVAVSVPKGAPATLTVADQGKTATYDLRSAKPATDADTQLMALSASPMITAAAPASAKASATWSDGTNSGGLTVTSTFVPDSCFLTPWHPKIGWAKPGRGWYVLAHTTRASWDKYTVQVVIDPTKQASLTVGKTPVKPMGDPIDLVKNIVAITPQQLLFDVPAQGFTGGKFSMTLPHSFLLTYKDGQKRTLSLKSSGALATTLTVKPE